MNGESSTRRTRYSYLTSEIDAAYHEAALKFGLSDSAMRILYTICLSGEDCLLSDIVRFSGISKQTINSSLRKLEGQGILSLRAAEGRRKQVCLTEAGKALVRDSVLQVLRIENEIFDSWSQTEQELYVELTARFLSAFQQKIKEIKV